MKSIAVLGPADKRLGALPNHPGYGAPRVLTFFRPLTLIFAGLDDLIDSSGDSATLCCDTSPVDTTKAQ